MKKRILSAILTASMIIGLISANAVLIDYEDLSISEEQESNIYFEDIEIIEPKEIEPVQAETVLPEETVNTDLDSYINYEELTLPEATVTTNPNISTFSTRQDVQVSVTNKPVVDIFLASKQTNVNLETFEIDVKNALKNFGIDISEVEFVTINREYHVLEYDGLNFADAVNSWKTIGAPIWSATDDYIYCNIVGGQTQWNLGTMPAGSATVTRDATKRYQDLNTNATAWWGSVLIAPGLEDTEKLDLSFSVERTGNLKNGFCFNVTDNGNGRVSGYFMELTNHLYFAPNKKDTINVFNDAITIK